MRDYPKFVPESTKDLVEVIKFIVKERRFDIADFNNIQNTFMAGRKVGKVPADSNDITATDRLGDFNTDADYLYIVIDDAGDAKWRRVALSTW